MPRVCRWTILHKVLTRLSDFDGAVSTLEDALRAKHITPDAAGSTITSSLRYDAGRLRAVIDAARVSAYTPFNTLTCAAKW